MKTLDVDLSAYEPKLYNVKTNLGQIYKDLKLMNVDCELVPGRILPLPVLVDNDFAISFNIDGLADVFSNFEQLNLKLAAELVGSNDIRVHGLIGIDFIQFIKPMKVVDCMNGVAFEVAQGLIPFGNIDHFLHKSLIKPVIYPQNFIITILYCNFNINTSNHSLKIRSS